MADQQPERTEGDQALQDASGSTGTERRSPFSDEELEHFKELILKRRRAATEDIERMRGQIEEASEQASDNTAYSFHMADAGTDAMEREKLYLMIARQQKYIGYLDRALERIENKTYGICKVTGKPISKERLEAVPHTEISIDAKLKQKKKQKQS
jgi:RNA polymerase-binding protein DksA